MGNSHLNLRFFQRMSLWELQGHRAQKDGGITWIVGHYAAIGVASLVIVGQCWLLPRRASGCLLKLETHSAVTAKRGDLSPNGSCFVIQHVSHLVNNNFLCVQTFFRKVWISFDLGRKAGVRLLRLLICNYLSVGWR